jgi:uncharacterized protein YxeA
MDSIFIFITIIIAIILLLLIINRNNTNDVSQTNKKPNDKILKDNFINKENSYSLIGDEDKYKNVVDGYENELMYENNLKGGDYVKQFTEIDFSRIPKTNNQIGFNPQPRESTESKLPFADINVNCL